MVLWKLLKAFYNHADGHKPPALPIAVMYTFNDYAGPAWSDGVAEAAVPK